MDEKSYRPAWVPEHAGQEFAIKILKKIDAQESGSAPNNKMPIRKKLEVKDYVEGVLASDRTVLARAITLIESGNQQHNLMAQQVLRKLLPYTGNSLRIGISGVPGAGKSSMIEELGLELIKQGHRVAVLAVDPSSSITLGSILGDKTRMEKLSRQNDCFIRPSPSSGTLGGVARKSRETILICEAAGYDVILIETVGVGQSEITVRSMVDFFLLVMISGAGDELQGIKKGVIEIADALVVNKADGDNKMRAEMARAEYSQALKYLSPATRGWRTEAYCCSAYTREGLPELWQVIKNFEDITKSSGYFEQRRKNQSLEWVFKMIEEHLLENFYNNPLVKSELPVLKENILSESILPTEASEKLLKIFYESKSI